jgi:hypothetical protein
MEGIHATGIPAVLGTLTPMERVQAMRDYYEPGDNSLPTELVVAAFLFALMLLFVGYIALRMMDSRRARRFFLQQAQRMNMSEGETSALMHLAKLSRTRDISFIFSSDSLFDKGVQRWLEKEDTEVARNLIRNLRLKLGFSRTAAPEALSEITTQLIPPGARVTLMAGVLLESIDAEVIENAPEGFLLEPTEPCDLQGGHGIVIRYSSEGESWDFSTHVLAVLPGRLKLAHTHAVTPRSWLSGRSASSGHADKEPSVSETPVVKDAWKGAESPTMSGKLISVERNTGRIQTDLEAFGGSSLWMSAKLSATHRVECAAKVKSRELFNGRWILHVEFIDLKEADRAALAQAVEEAGSRMVAVKSIELEPATQEN